MTNLDDVKARLAAREELNRLLADGGAHTLRHRQLDDTVYDSVTEAQVRRLLQRVEALETALRTIQTTPDYDAIDQIARRALDGD